MVTPFFLATKFEKCKICLGVVLALAESVADPAATIIMGKYFQQIGMLMKGEITSIQFLNTTLTYTYVLVGICCYTVVISALGYIVWSSIGYNLGSLARRRMFTVLIRQQQKEFDEQKNLSSLATMYFKDIQDLETAAGICSYEIIAMISGCIIELAVALYFSWAVTLICLAGIPLMLLIGILLSSPIEKRIKKSKAILDEISAHVSWVLRSIQTVKIFQKEHSEARRIHNSLMRLKQVSNSYWLLFKLQQGATRALVLMVFMQGFYFGSYMVKSHGLPPGNVVSVFWCCLNASALLQTALQHSIEWQKGKASAERLQVGFEMDAAVRLKNSIGLMPASDPRIERIYDELGWNTDKLCQQLSATSTGDSGSLLPDSPKPNSVTPAKEKSTLSGHIVFSDVVFSYPQRHELVYTGLSMDIPPGTICFVLGKSGSGKSSLAALLSKQYPWSAGEIEIDGHSVHLLSQNWIEENVYVCEQVPKLFDLSIRENITLSGSFVSSSDIDQAIEDACAGFVWNLPQKLDSTGLDSLSGGEKQRISLARARIRNAPITIFDEATSALDPALKKKVISKILRYRKGMTTIIITHEQYIIPDGFPVFFIQNGASRMYNTISEMRNSESDHLSSARRSRLSVVGEKITSLSKVSELSETDSEISATDSHDVNGSNLKKRKVLSSANTALLAKMMRRASYVIGLLFTIIHASLNPAFSFFFSKLIMGILDPSSKNTTLWAMLVLMCAIVDGLSVFMEYTTNFAAESWLLSIRERLFTQLMARPATLSATESSYFTKLLLNDTEKCTNIVTNYWPSMISMVILCTAGFSCALYFGWKLTLVILSLFPVFVLLNALYRKVTTHWTQKREALRGNVVRLMRDLTSETGFRTLKSQHLERYFESVYTERELKTNSITLLLSTQIGGVYGAVKCIPYALESLLLWYGTKLVGDGEYTVQNTMSVFAMIMFTVITIDQLCTTIGSVGTGFEAQARLADTQRALEAEHQLLTFDNQKTPRFDGQLPSWNEIYFHRVGAQYADGKKVLGNFCARMKTGETVAIVGPSGCGKSTLARLLLRLETPSTGEIVVDQKWDLNDISIFDVRANVSLVGQAPYEFFEGSIEENLLYSLDPSDELGASQLEAVCKLCGAHDFICQLPEGYDTRINESLLSGGQLQRLAIARTLLRRPKVLILDECTSALDSDSKAIVMSMIRKLQLSYDILIIIITHEMDVAELANRIINLDGE